MTGKCGSVRVRLIPAPRGTGLVAAPATRKMLSMAGIQDCYTSSRGHTRTMGNFLKAIYFALQNTYGFLSLDLWAEMDLGKSPSRSTLTSLPRRPSGRKVGNIDHSRSLAFWGEAGRGGRRKAFGDEGIFSPLKAVGLRPAASTFSRKSYIFRYAPF